MAAALPFVAVAASVGGALLSAKAQSDAGTAAAYQARYQAQVARNNQILAEREAQDATAAGEVAAQRQSQLAAQRMGGVRAAAAAAGVDPGSGSALDLYSDTAKAGMLDVLTVRNNARRQAYGYTVEGQGFQGDAALAEASARNALAAGQVSAFGSLLGGASSVADKWLRYRSVGVV